jgi:tetratricopeptide (TPR) repeat protein
MILDMKKNIIFLIFLVLTGAACDDFLDVEPDNRTEVDLSDDNVTQMLVSAYPTRTFVAITEMMSDNTDRIEEKSNYDDRSQAEFFYWMDATETDEDSPHEFWQASYKAIAAANETLAAIERLGSPENLNPQKGEALLCRAYNHFALVNVFSKHWGSTSTLDLGIPYIKTPETKVAPHYSRGTVDSVYIKIAADLEAGLPLLDDNIYTIPKYHFNRKAAYAFAARFYLYYRKYDKVIAAAGEALGTNPAASLRDWATAGSSSDIEINWNSFIDNANPANLLLIPATTIWAVWHGPFYNGSYYTHATQVAAQTTMSSGPWGAYSTIRYPARNFAVGKVNTVKIGYWFEFSDPVAQIGNAHSVIPAFTTDETLLCRAEAYALTGDLDNATADVNTFLRAFTTSSGLDKERIINYYKNLKYYDPKEPTVKQRLNPEFPLTEDQENFIHCVLHLRRILTIHEGLRWFDVKRYGIEIYRRSITRRGEIILLDSLMVDDHRRAIQLPRDMITAGLAPNPRNN